MAPRANEGEREQLELELVDELARVFSDEQQARVLALRAGFESQHMPKFESPLVFWMTVVQEAANGRHPGVQAIANEAAAQYPRNPIFARHRSPSVLDDPGASIGQKSVVQSNADPMAMPRAVHDRHLDDREVIFVSFAGEQSQKFKDEIAPFFVGKKVVSREDFDPSDKEQLLDHLEHCRGAIALVDKYYLSEQGFVADHEIPILLRRAFSQEIPLVPILASNSSGLLHQEFEIRVPDGSNHLRRLTELTWAPSDLSAPNGQPGHMATPLGHLTVFKRDDYYADAVRLISGFPARRPPILLPLGTEDSGKLVASLKRASVPLLGWPRTINDTWLDRPEANRIMQRLETSASSTTLLLGPPGSGKSALLAHIAKTVGERWAVLGIKADYLLPTVCSPADLAHSLSLDGDPIEIVRRVACAERPCLIVLDQLDVLSSFVERHAERLEVLLNLAASAHQLPHVHVLSSCRLFEYKYDRRLQGLDPAPIHLELPPLEKALELLRSETDFAIPDATKDLEILRSPQYLKLVVDNAGRLSSLPEAVSSQTFLSKLIEMALSNSAATAGAALATRMGEREALWCDEQEAGLPPLQELLDTGFVVRENGRVRFAHQVIFEHLWARSMISWGVSTVVLEGEQSLLARPRIRNALKLLGLWDPERFQTELDALWSSPELQYHIRRLVIDVVAHTDAPSDRDLHWVRNRFQEEDWHVYTLQRLGSDAWFDALLPDDLPSLMGDQRFNADGLAVVLHAAIRSRPRKVVRLLRNHWLRADRIFKLQWMIQSLPWAEPWTRELWREIASFPDYEPAILCGHLKKVEGHHGDAADLIARRMGTAFDSAFFGNSESTTVEKDRVLFSTNWAHAREIVSHAPGRFLDRLWPQLQEAFEHYKDEPTYWSGYHGGVIALRFDAKYHRTSMIATIRQSIRDFARQDPPGFIALLRGRLRSRSADLHQMIGRGLETLASAWPAFIVEYLTKEPERLHVRSWDRKPWSSRQLVAMAGIHASDHDVLTLERAILALAPEEQSMRDVGEFDDEQLKLSRDRDLRLKLWLLEVIPDERLSSTALEWKTCAVREAGARRWGSEKPARPQVVPIPSPVSRTQFLAMKPEEIIEIFQELHDATEWRHPNEPGMGGSIEASREFAAAMKDAPEHAIAVFPGFEPGKQERPVALTLQAWADAERADLVVEWARHFDERGFRTPKFRADVAYALRNVYEHQTMDDDTHEMLLRWLDEWEVEPKEEKTTPVEHGIERPLLENHGGLIPQGSWSVLDALLTGLLQREPPSTHDALEALRRNAAVISSPSVLASFGRESFPRMVDADRAAATAAVLDLLEARPHLLYAPESTLVLSYLCSPDPMLNKRLHHVLLQVKRGSWEAGPQLWAEMCVMAAIFHGLDWARDAVTEIVNDEHIEHVERQVAGVIHSAGRVAADEGCAPEQIHTAVRWLVALAPRVPLALHSAWMEPLNRHRFSKVSVTQLLPLLRAAAIHYELLAAADEDVLEVALEIIADEPGIAFGVAHGFLAARHTQDQRVVLRGDAMKSIIAVLQRTPNHRYNAVLLMESLLKHDAYGAEQFLVELERD